MAFNEPVRGRSREVAPADGAGAFGGYGVLTLELFPNLANGTRIAAVARPGERSTGVGD